MLSHTHKVLPISRPKASSQLRLFLIRQESKDFYFTCDFVASYSGLAQALLSHWKDFKTGFLNKLWLFRFWLWPQLIPHGGHILWGPMVTWGHSWAVLPQIFTIHLLTDLPGLSLCPRSLLSTKLSFRPRRLVFLGRREKQKRVLGVSYLCSVRGCRGDQGAGTQLDGDRKGNSRDQGTEQVLLQSSKSLHWSQPDGRHLLCQVTTRTSLEIPGILQHTSYLPLPDSH